MVFDASYNFLKKVQFSRICAIINSIMIQVALFWRNMQLKNRVAFFPKKCATQTYELNFFQEICNSNIRVVSFSKKCATRTYELQFFQEMCKWQLIFEKDLNFTWVHDFLFCVKIHRIFIFRNYACSEKKFARHRVCAMASQQST
jgi:hypothetical protein